MIYCMICLLLIYGLRCAYSPPTQTHIATDLFAAYSSPIDISPTATPTYNAATQTQKPTNKYYSSGAYNAATQTQKPTNKYYASDIQYLSTPPAIVTSIPEPNREPTPKPKRKPIPKSIPTPIPTPGEGIPDLLYLIVQLTKKYMSNAIGANLIHKPILKAIPNILYGSPMVTPIPKPIPTPIPTPAGTKYTLIPTAISTPAPTFSHIFYSIYGTPGFILKLVMCQFNPNTPNITKDLVVHTYTWKQIYNNNDTYTWKQIYNKLLPIKKQELKRHILALAHPKVKVLNKLPNKKN